MIRSLVKVENLQIARLTPTFPSRFAENHLKPHAVVVHVIRHRPSVRDANVRSDVAASQAAGEQVTILHIRAARYPGGGARFGDDELLLAFGNSNRRIGFYELDLDAAGGFEFTDRGSAERSTRNRRVGATI